MKAKQTLGIHINQLMSQDSALKIREAIETVSSVQQSLYTLANNEDSAEMDLLKIGTVFQIFLIDTLAAGKKAGELSESDWRNIADKVNQYAVLEDGQSYSEFVFTMYADYIDLSVKVLEGKAREEYLTSIQELSDTIRSNSELLRNEEIKETAYIEACLWLSLEAMIKLLSSFFTMKIPKEYADLILSASQLAFEYGRYVLYAKEQAILEKYIRNQYVLDEQLRRKYEEYLKEVQFQAEKFQELVEDAFYVDIRQSLEQSAALAREAGVKEEELLQSVDDVDAFFMD